MPTQRTFHADGTEEVVEVPEPPPPTIARAEQLTPAMIRLRERMAARGEHILPLVLEREGLESETWFLKRLSFSDTTVMSFCLSRQGYTLMDMRSEAAVLAFMQAMVYVTCCKSDTDNSRFFADLSEVETWWNEPGLTEVCSALFGAAVLHNPEYLPKAMAPSAPVPLSEQ